MVTVPEPAPNAGARPLATVSVDMDPVDLHLLGYGVRDAAPDPLIWERALPRLLERFRRAGVRATWFVVGRDAEVRAGRLREVVLERHEVASHSLTHPLALSRLPADALAREVTASRAALEAATGRPVVGFRAPNFDVDARVLDALAAAGYRYDASDYPSPVLAAARAALAASSRAPLDVMRLRALPRTFARLPHVVRTAHGALQAFPLTVTRWARWPVYHTLRYGREPHVFRARLDAIAARGEPLSYSLHAVDALGLEEDRVDRRLAAHPGMRVPLADKLALLDDTLQSIARRFQPLPFAERLPEGMPAADPA